MAQLILASFLLLVTLGGCNPNIPKNKYESACIETSTSRLYTNTHNKNVLYFAVLDSFDSNSVTFQKLSEKITSFKPDVCIVQGIETNQDYNPPEVLAEAKKKRMPYHISTHALKLCHRNGAKILGADPDEHDLLKAATGLNYKEKDYVYYALGRQVVIWNGEGALKGISGGERNDKFQRFLDAKKSKLKLADSYTVKGFKKWHKLKTCEDFDINSCIFDPLQRNTAASREVDANIYQEIASALQYKAERHAPAIMMGTRKTYDRIMLIHSKDHYNFVAPKLNKALGQPVEVKHYY